LNLVLGLEEVLAAVAGLRERNKRNIKKEEKRRKKGKRERQRETEMRQEEYMLARLRKEHH
jgi:hypothetical protein